MCQNPNHEPEPGGGRWRCKSYPADCLIADTCTIPWNDGKHVCGTLGSCNGYPRRTATVEDGRPEQVGGTHYRDLKYEPFDVIEDWSKGWPDKMSTYMIGNAMKYLARLGRKGDPASDEEAKAWMRQDLDKAVHYLTEARNRL